MYLKPASRKVAIKAEPRENILSAIGYTKVI